MCYSHRMLGSRALSFRQIEAFAAVIATGSLTGAAQRLGRSQPVVTRLIQELEAELGYALLHRNGPRVAPTDRGLRFHREVERHLLGLALLRERAEAIGRDERPSLTLAAIPALAAGLLPGALAGLGALPRQVHLQSAAAEQVVQMVGSRGADLGLVSLPVPHPGLALLWAAEADCIAVLRPDDPLAAAPVLRLADLASRRLVSTANPNRLRHRVEEALRAAGVVPEAVVDSNTSLAAMGAVRAGLGIALTEPVTPAGLPVEGLVTRPLDAAIPFRFGAVVPAGQPLAPPLPALLVALEAAARAALPGLRTLPVESAS
ncbi:LysR family transcriptional regulator [Belnapia sp. T6]|uniref:LysR family transcriptional regulator n=1 Tax=Belnapia mucosa TaxID=2804532 RepID=A0ABS1V7Q9_9PROT|nr:LysR family transcriptional regulator [Belnapia mucosa]MBL6457706.1 LysR family transcriptional regulator [Belnapia mucosa]